MILSRLVISVHILYNDTIRRKGVRPFRPFYYSLPDCATIGKNFTCRAEIRRVGGKEGNAVENLSNIGVIRDLLARHGFRFSKALGQNFLVNPTVCPRMAEQGGAGPGVGVIEIGAGPGC